MKNFCWFSLLNLSAKLQGPNESLRKIVMILNIFLNIFDVHSKWNIGSDKEITIESSQKMNENILIFNESILSCPHSRVLFENMFREEVYCRIH